MRAMCPSHKSNGCLFVSKIVTKLAIDSIERGRVSGGIVRQPQMQEFPPQQEPNSMTAQPVAAARNASTLWSGK